MDTHLAKEERLLNTKEVARRLRCSERHIANLILAGRLSPIRLGRSVRFN